MYLFVRMIFVFCILQYDILKFSLAFTSTTTRIKLFKLGWFLCCCFFLQIAACQKWRQSSFFCCWWWLNWHSFIAAKGPLFSFFIGINPPSARIATQVGQQELGPTNGNNLSHTAVRMVSWFENPLLGQVNWKQLTKVKKDQKQKQTKK